MCVKTIFVFQRPESLPAGQPRNESLPEAERSLLDGTEATGMFIYIVITIFIQ